MAAEEIRGGPQEVDSTPTPFTKICLYYLYSEELIGVISSYHNDIMIGCMEGAVKGLHVLSWAHTLEGETLLLVPVPQNDFVAVFTSEGGKKWLLSRGGKANGNEFLSNIVWRGEHLLALWWNWRVLVKPGNVPNQANRTVSSFADSNVLLWRT